MRLVQGEPAPGFSVEDLHGREVSIEAFRGRRLLLSFFRYAACPLCNLRTAFLIDAYPRLRSKGLKIAAVFESTRGRLLETVARQSIPFPVIPDPERRLYRTYGVTPSLLGTVRGAFRVRALREAFRRGFHIGRADGAATQLPAEFLIGPDSVIERAYYGRDIGDHLPIEEIDRWLDGQTV